MSSSRFERLTALRNMIRRLTCGPAAQTSQVYWHYVLVTLALPGPCMLDVTVVATSHNATLEGNTKVKVCPPPDRCTLAITLAACSLIGEEISCTHDTSLWQLLSFETAKTAWHFASA